MVLGSGGMVNSFGERGRDMVQQGDLFNPYNLSGAWVLELSSRSETLERYLRCMLMSDAAIRAQVSGERSHESRNVIAISGSTMVMHKRTKLTCCTESYELGREKVTQTRFGTKRSIASFGGRGRADGFVLTTTMPTSSGQIRLVETRQVLEGGRTMAQILHLGNLSTGEQSVTRRTWVRTSMSELDEEMVDFWPS